MTVVVQDLIELAGRCERATDSDRELDEAICLALNRDQVTRHIQSGELINVPEFTKLIDVALRINPDWFWRAGHGSENPGWAHLNKFHLSHCDRCDETHSIAATPALALCAASLRARASIKGTG